MNGVFPLCAVLERIPPTCLTEGCCCGGVFLCSGGVPGLRSRFSVLSRLSFSPQSWNVCPRIRSAWGCSAVVAIVAVSSANSMSPKTWVFYGLLRVGGGHIWGPSSLYFTHPQKLSVLCLGLVLIDSHSVFFGDDSPWGQLDDRHWTAVERTDILPLNPCQLCSLATWYLLPSQKLWLG